MKDKAPCSKKSMYVNAVAWVYIFLMFAVSIFLVLLWMYALSTNTTRNIVIPVSNHHIIGVIGVLLFVPTCARLYLMPDFFHSWRHVMDGSATKEEMRLMLECTPCLFLSTRFTEAYQARMVVLDEET